MRENPIKTEYSHDGEYRYEIVGRNDGLFQVWAQKKIYDEYLGEEIVGWHDIKDYVHISDNYKRAEEIGVEVIRNLAGTV